MERYVEVNGLANYWNRDHICLEVARWIYHHPELAERLYPYIKDHQPWPPNPHIDWEILTDEEIDLITGVLLDGNNENTY